MILEVFTLIILIVILFLFIRIVMVNKNLRVIVKEYDTFIENAFKSSDTDYQRLIIMSLLGNGIQPIDVSIIGDRISGLAAYKETDDSVIIYKLGNEDNIIRFEKKALINILPIVGEKLNGD